MLTGKSMATLFLMDPNASDCANPPLRCRMICQRGMAPQMVQAQAPQLVVAAAVGEQVHSATASAAQL